MGKGRKYDKGRGPISQRFEKLQQVLQLENAIPGTTRDQKSQRAKETSSQQKRTPQASGESRTKKRNLTPSMCQPINLAIAMDRPSQILIETLIDFGVGTGRSTRSNENPKTGEKDVKSITKL